MKRYRLHLYRSSDFDDPDDYARTVLGRGGPDPDDFVFSGTGRRAELAKAIWGEDDTDFGRIVCLEQMKQQADNPHIFINKYRPPYGLGRWRTRGR
ncbi:hypothetical protein [Methylobacterium gregans]|uniref:Uncharacterized protein n=1 Tax=Methylobacterium gregans TaxID=374424 RepID=A0AA37HSS1_9HYPH|nr:hypothetical protein [Methylobacterium gregans]MDQ0521261.1 hypothetical protein [Methylobacterium gregans]GJD80891.1 hypothetical protein NBEOAGPD_4134 [Methylobacterium gregans]GLS54425.1 hypothetical protein GCM10007886_26080 [Methylobacterium gregans]